MTLHMLHLPLRPGALVRHGREHGLVGDRWAADEGYLAHSLLARLFGADAPKPFDVGESADHLLAYSPRPYDDLAALARARNDAALAGVDWARAGGKPMPALPAGRRLGFRVRVCPAVRVHPGHPRFAAGAEVDPYLLQVEAKLAPAEAANPGLDPRALKAGVVAALPPREDAYRTWFAARVKGAAVLDGVRVAAMRDARLWRRGTPGPGPAGVMHGRDRPRHGDRSAVGRRDVVFEGTLTVAEPAAFAALLARGVGRHRAFGFGMVLLRSC